MILVLELTPMVSSFPQESSVDNFRYCLILHILSFIFFEKKFKAFFTLEFLSDISTKFCTFCLFVF